MSEPQDIFPAVPTEVDTPYQPDPPQLPTGTAYIPGAPIIPARDDQQFPDTDKGITG